MGVFLAAEKAAADAKAAAEAAEAARLAEEEARRNAVYEDKPVLSRPYVSETAEATLDEVRELKTTPERPLLGCTVVRPRSSFGHPYNFDNRDAEITFKWPSQMNPDFETKQMERDVGLQGALPQANSSSQTTWYRPVNKGVQYSAVGAQDASAAENPALVAFLKRVRPTVEDALQQNETVDIFKDAFAGVGDEDAAVGQKGDNELKEMRNYNDIKYSKAMSISAIDWHPTRKVREGEREFRETRERGREGTCARACRSGPVGGGGGSCVEFRVVTTTLRPPLIRARLTHTTTTPPPSTTPLQGMIAVSPTRNLSFDERVEQSGQAHTAHILLWDFIDLIHPQIMLQVPGQPQPANTTALRRQYQRQRRRRRQHHLTITLISRRTRCSASGSIRARASRIWWPRAA